MIGKVEVQKTSLSALGLPDSRTSLCVAFSWRYVKDKVYFSPLLANIDGMKDLITTAINSVNRNMLRSVWEEFSYRLDVVRAAGSVHIEHL